MSRCSLPARVERVHAFDELTQRRAEALEVGGRAFGRSGVGRWAAAARRGALRSPGRPSRRVGSAAPVERSSAERRGFCDVRAGSRCPERAPS